MKKEKYRILLCLLGVAVLCLLVGMMAVSCQNSGNNGNKGDETDRGTGALQTGTDTAPETDAISETDAPTEPEPDTLPAPDTQPVTETEPLTDVPVGPVDTQPETVAETEDPMADYLLEPVDHVSLPESSSTLSYELAGQLLTLCSNSSLEMTKAYCRAAGFDTFLADRHYDKDPTDTSHTSGFLIASQRMTYNGEEREVLLVVVRGTYAGEWYSNFDFAPSMNPDTSYAENFKAAAEDVYTVLGDMLEATQDPVVLVCGHSRGAAVANLLGGILNEKHDPADVFVYTFATPGTVRGDGADADATNIFNFINPLDIVTELPLKAWGYTHLGQDIILPLGDRPLDRMNAAKEIMSTLAPDIRAYYEDKHSLTEAGLSEDGMTSKEFMGILAKMLIGMSTGEMNIDYTLFMVREESDFRPFVDLLLGIMQGGEDGVASVFGQHLPKTYQILIQMQEALDTARPATAP